jgi:hypothetical protein
LYKTTTVVWDREYTTNQAANITSALATYTWDATNHNLKEGSVAFALPSDLSDSDSLDNIWSGALVCEADVPSDTSIDPYRLQNEVTTYYRFSAGAQNWNKFQGLKDADGAFVKFDAPLELSYTHSTASDFDGNSTQDGKSFRLSYNGPGQLHGMPWKFDKDIGREMPLFSIKAGVKIGDYTVYPRDGEQRLVKTADSNCAGLSLSGISKLPSNENKIITIAWSESEDTEIRYIGGVSTAATTLTLFDD